MECYPSHDSDSQAPDEFGHGIAFSNHRNKHRDKTNVHVHPLPGVW
jgi:hypothetical protein